MKYSYKQLIENILKFESDNSLDKLSISGVFVWDLIRFPVYRRLEKALIFENVNFVANDNRRNKRIKFALNSIFNIKRNPFFKIRKRKDLDLLLIGHGRRRLIDKEMIDITCDTIIKDLTCSWDFIEPDDAMVHYKTKKNFKFTDIIITLASIKGLFYRNKVIITEEERRKLDNLSQSFKNTFEVDVGIQSLTTKAIIDFQIQIPLYEKMLKKYSPKAISIVVSYGREILIKAAQNLNIPIIEFQHGVINKYHLGYSYEYISKTYKPDHFLTFGNYWKDAVTFAIPNIHNIGFKFYNLQKNSKVKTHEEYSILIISAEMIGFELSKLIAEVSELFPNQIFYYKLHPAETKNWEQDYSWLMKNNINVIYDNPDLYTLFSKVKMQIGVSSTALYEGLGYNLPTCIIPLSGHEYLQDLIDKKIVSVTNTAKELSNFITSKLGMENVQIDSYFEFFKEYDPNNLNSTISKIIMPSK